MSYLANRRPLDPERLARLPKWAAEHIELVERDLAGLIAKMEPADDAPVFVIDPRNGDRPIGDARTVIAFRLADDGGIGGMDRTIEVRLDPDNAGGVIVYGHGGGSLTVRPHVSNVIRASMDRDY